MAIFLVAILLTLSTKSVHTSPFSSPMKRNVCDWVDAEPVLYTEYHSDVCPPPKTFADGQGNCELSFKDKPQCENFCPVRVCIFLFTNNLCSIREDFAYKSTDNICIRPRATIP
jgi:hypothetical protein